MAILDYVSKHRRSRIGLVGEEPSEDDVKMFKECGGYELFRFEQSDLTDVGKLATTGAVIFQQAVQHPRRVLRELEQFAATLLWHDCRVFVRPVPATPGGNGPAFRSMIIETLNALKLPPSNVSDADKELFGDWYEPDVRPLTPCVHILDSPSSWSDVAVLLRNNPAGTPPRHDLNIAPSPIDFDGRSQNLTPEQEVLVRRAFANCTSIQLVGLTNGLSKVLTFRAFAHLQDLDGAAGGKWPFVYFVKIGARGKIAREYSAYRANALELIPYHLGPRLRLDRCELGHLEGIIVSDYVSGAEALRDCAKDGRAVPAIANLFNATLWAWRKNAVEEPLSLQDYLSEKMCLPMPSHRKPLISEFGAAKTTDELWSLFMARKSKPVLVGVVHGDLHATNVLVRGNDAIVIDFEKVESRAPLLWDMASLEGGLFVDGFVGDRRTWLDVLRSVECLYKPAAFEDDVVTCHPSDESAWFFDCVRQIRMQARQIELASHQYALALAIALLRKACNPEDWRKTGTDAADGLPRESARALAYVLAESILVGLAQGDSGQMRSQ